MNSSIVSKPIFDIKATEDNNNAHFMKRGTVTKKNIFEGVFKFTAYEAKTKFDITVLEVQI